MELHQSTLNTYETCERKFQYRYLEGLGAGSTNQTLLLGTAFHKGLEWYYEDYPKANPLDYLSSLKRRYRELSDENKEILRGMLQAYGYYSRANDPELIKKVVATEYEFEVPVVGPDEEEIDHTLAGTVDLIIRNHDDEIVVIDHKTRTRLEDDKDYLSIDNQVLLYTYVLSQEFGEIVDNFIYNTVLKKAPRKPKVLKSGNLSKSKRLKSLPEIVIKAIKDHYDGSVPVGYKDLISSQFQKGNTFVKRINVPISFDQLVNFEENIYYKIQEIEDKDKFFRQPGKYKCKYCDFLQVCVADSKNGDAEFLKSFLK